MRRRITFAEFDRLYALRRRSRRTLRFLTSSSEKKIRRTLRGHWDDAIDDEDEIGVRDNLDYLLGAHSMLEIVAFLDAAADWPDDVFREAGSILDHPVVRKYYEDTYPLVLPRLFRARLAGELPETYSGAVAGSTARDETALIRLVDLDRRRMADNELEAFLSLLDGYNHGEWFIEDFVEALTDRKTVERELERDARKKPGAPRSDLMTLLAGLDSFLRYADELSAFLRPLEGQLISSLAWLHHSYFYGDSADNVQLTLGSIRRILRRFAGGRKSAVIAAARAEHFDGILHDLADRHKWLAPAFNADLESFLGDLKPRAMANSG